MTITYKTVLSEHFMILYHIYTAIQFVRYRHNLSDHSWIFCSDAFRMMNIVHDKDVCDFPNGPTVDHIFHPIKSIFVNVIVARHKHLAVHELYVYLTLFWPIQTSTQHLLHFCSATLHFHDFFQGGGDWFLDEDVLTGFEGHDYELTMSFHARQNKNSIDGLVFYLM